MNQSSSKFIHHELVGSLQTLTTETPCLKALYLEDLVQLLPDNIDPSLYTMSDFIDWNPTGHGPTEEWIRKFWNFLVEGAKVAKISRMQYADISDKLERLGSWCLLPAVNRKQKILVAFSKRYLVMNKTSFHRLNDLFRLVSKLDIPVPYTEPLEYTSARTGSMSERSELLNTLVTNSTNANQVLRCLHYHTKEIRKAHLKSNEATTIVRYFSKTIEDDATFIKQNKRLLGELPIFCTLNGQLISLQPNMKYLTVIGAFPDAGMITWGDSMKMTILSCDEYDRDNLISKLDVDTLGVETFYTSYLLPGFVHLPNKCHMQHLRFLKNEHLYCNDEIAHVLKNVRFVQHGDTLLTAGMFYSPDINLLKVMGAEAEFPSEPFCDVEWRDFMKMAGMMTELLPNRFIKFLVDLKRQGITNKSETRCQTAILYMFDNYKWAKQHQIFERSCEITFILPHVVSPTYRAIHGQYCTDRLISYSESVLRKYELLAWTSSCILPDFAYPHTNRLLQASNIEMDDKKQKPNMSIVIQHTRNVTVALSEKCERYNPEKSLNSTDINSVMTKLYEYLAEHIDHITQNRELKIKLSEISLIYFPDRILNNNLFLKPMYVVEQWTDDQQIYPYLMRMPGHYGMYAKLFYIFRDDENHNISTICKCT